MSRYSCAQAGEGPARPGQDDPDPGPGRDSPAGQLDMLVNIPGS
jgi:hypothetical protein